MDDKRSYVVLHMYRNKQRVYLSFTNEIIIDMDIDIVQVIDELCNCYVQRHMILDMVAYFSLAFFQWCI
jgi:hypothetical protein